MDLHNGPTGLTHDEQLVQRAQIRDASELDPHGPLVESDTPGATSGTLWDHDPRQLDEVTRDVNVRGMAAARRILEQTKGPEGK